MRTYWLSFCDEGGSLGVVVVDVTEGDADTARATPMHDLENGPWISAALRLAWRAKVNPGGEVASWRIDGNPHAAIYPRLTLMSRADIAALEPEL